MKPSRSSALFLVLGLAATHWLACPRQGDDTQQPRKSGRGSGSEGSSGSGSGSPSGSSTPAGSGSSVTTATGTTGGTGTGTASGASPATDGAAFVKGHGEETIAACSGLDSGSEPCLWAWRADPAACGGKLCDKLVIYFSGGQMSCPEASNDESYLAGFEARGYVAVCARLYETAEASGEYPYNLEAKRADLLVRTVMEHPKIKAAWSGKHLLITGVSHGATTPVIAMARTPFDDTWKGTGKVGACFLDGIYDIPALFDHLRTNKCGKINSVLSYQRAYGRHCKFPEDATFPSKWPQPSDCATEAVKADTVAAVGATPFAIKDWKLVECGRDMDPCREDVVPGAPIEALCSGIDGKDGHHCAFASEPQKTHIECGSAVVAVPHCGEWFDGLVGP